MPTGDLKHRAKRWNERVKLVATPFTSVAIVTLAAALIDPIAGKHDDVLADGFWPMADGFYFSARRPHILPDRSC